MAELFSFPWPATMKASAPSGAIYTKEFVATREDGASTFAIMRPKTKSLTFFEHTSPITAWKTFDSLLFVMHANWSLQIVDLSSNKVASFTMDYLFLTLCLATKALRESDDLELRDFAQAIAVNESFFCVVTKKGVLRWERKDALSLVDYSLRFIPSAKVQLAFDSCTIDSDNELFVPSSSSWTLYNLRSATLVPQPEWKDVGPGRPQGESNDNSGLSQYFRMCKFDKFIVGAKSTSLVIWNLDRSTRREIYLKSVATALYLDQSYFITGHGDGQLYLRDISSGDTKYGIQIHEDEPVKEDDDERSVLGGAVTERRRAASRLFVNVAEKINMIKRVGRYVIVAHEAALVTIWDLTKAYKHPIQSLKTSWSVRSFSIVDEEVVFGCAVPSESAKGGKKPLRTSKTTNSTSFSKRLSSPRDSNSLGGSNSISEVENEVTVRSGKKDKSAKKEESPEFASGYITELYVWNPKLDNFGEMEPLRRALLPLPDFTGRTLQQQMDSFVTPVDWWEFHTRFPRFSILIFFRGLWDERFCGRYLKRWQRIYQMAANGGGSVVAITCDTAENAAKAKQNLGISFECLSDRTNYLAKYFNVTISKSNDFPYGMNEAGVFAVLHDRRSIFKWISLPNVITNLNGGRDRPDPLDVWNYIGHKIENPLEPVPLSCKMRIGCPWTHVGWKTWKKKDVVELPGGLDVLYLDFDEL